MESRPQNSEFRNNLENFHPFGTETPQDEIGPIGSSCFLREGMALCDVC